MGTEFKESETKKNLMLAFAGESQARNRYTFAASQAHHQGLYVIEQIFHVTAEQEKAHAEVFYNQLQELAGETIAITGGYPVDINPNIAQLLKMAQHNEYQEHDDVYRHFSEVAQKEGFGKAASRFKMIGEIEKLHGDRFGAFAKLLEDNQLFVSKIETKWMCLNCGTIYEGTEAPAKCPVCEKERGWFVRMELAPFCRAGEFEKFQ
ncbi:MAG: ferritin family protein [Lachnospiraceae bacterium]